MTDGEPAPEPITFQPSIYPKVLSLLPASKNLRILDAGAGEGYFSRLMQRAGYTDVTACDFLEEIWKCPDIPFVKANLNDAIPLGDASFECIVSIEVIEHVENHSRFIAELVRLLKPGGTLIISTPNTVTISGRWHFFLYGYNDCAPLPLDPTLDAYWMQHINPLSLPDLLFHLERHGAVLKAVETNRHRKSASFWWPLLRPLFGFALKRKLLRRKHTAQRGLHERHVQWMLSRNALLGRILIAVAEKAA
jgi:SAM-dependent methyltransferase